jgi:hypothetical protein
VSEPLPVHLTIGPTGSDYTKIEIGGVDVTKHVQGLALTSAPSDLTRLNLTFVKINVEVDGHVAEAGMPEAYKRFIEIVGDSIAGHVAEGEKS